jgi:NTE family protein
MAHEELSHLPGLPSKLPRRIAIIVVDAHTTADFGWDSREHSVSLGAMLGSLSQVAVSHYSFETIELFREVMMRISREKTQNGEPFEVATYVVELHFRQISDESDRRFYNAVPTTLQLPGKTVDRLRQLAARELAANAEFQRLLNDLRGAPLRSPSPNLRIVGNGN